jgi:hypothetical protein
VPGETLELRADGRTYLVLRNGIEVIRWTDTTNQIPVGPANRFIGIGGHRQFFNSSTRFEEWTGGDLPARGPLGYPSNTSYPSDRLYPSEGA